MMASAELGLKSPRSRNPAVASGQHCGPRHPHVSRLCSAAAGAAGGWQGTSAAEGNSKWWSSPAAADPALLPALERPAYRIRQADELAALIAREASHPSQPPWPDTCRAVAYNKR